jgi:class 3 adenylate cyclase
VEKIKTIGDAYMAVAGAPQALPDHADSAMRLAQRMLVETSEWRLQHQVDLELRVGLASGAVVGGVIGQQRILFDLWGDTVNTAQRMESSGIAGKIQVASSTRERLSDDYRFASREVDVKGIGRITAHVFVP